TPKAKHIRLQIEAKTVPRYANELHAPETISKAIGDLAQKYGLIDRIVIQSFDHRVVVAAKKILPSIRTAALLAPNFPDWLSVIKSTHADVLSPHLDWVTKEAVAAAHKIGTKVVPYTANTEADWEYLISCGVDGIITDDPKALLSFLRSRRLR
ncbi:MAG: glycerophosphodiester phosphodiesterase, partial [Deltaproteobacteria bacterium]|nr:glycerophosphodiester phosphodiesterase [Deltaproteobacteria bacterium]